VSKLNLKADLVPWLLRSWPVLLGVILVAFPTFRYIATQSWTTEQGSHGPLVLASGAWLLFNQWRQVSHHQVRPPLWQVIIVIVPLLVLYAVARIAAVIEIEVYALYFVLVATLFAFVGFDVMKRLWFPIFYLIFVVPLPDTLVSFFTNPLKIWISSTAVSALYALGYPVASAGVSIQIGQYQLLVAAACAGLNSLITLSALTVFYVYLTHRSNWKYMLLLSVAVVPVAIFSNFMRVLILILLTYHGGEAAAQGFLHNFSGLVTFAIALATIYLIDIAGQKLMRKTPQEVVTA
jgi:exosortase